MEIAPLTSYGDVTDAALSPDGRQLAYVRLTSDGRSIWVRQVATGSEVQVLAPAGPDTEIQNLMFTPDGEYLNYGAPGETSNVNDVFQVPSLGGTSTQ